MKFENTFDVKAPIDEVYAAMLDVERVAPCVPGAQVLEQSSEDSYKVSIKVKLGPIQMTYRGDVEIVERDEANHRAVMRARAREARGQGTADATVEMKLKQNGDGTHGDITSDVALSGKAASMGRGIIQDVSGKLVDQFLGEPRDDARGRAGRAGGPGRAGCRAAAPSARRRRRRPPATARRPERVRRRRLRRARRSSPSRSTPATSPARSSPIACAIPKTLVGPGGPADRALGSCAAGAERPAVD
ncbi:MAG: SRPBCC family protein [Solirubrobacteraceae bacterium]